MAECHLLMNPCSLTHTHTKKLTLTVLLQWNATLLVMMFFQIIAYFKKPLLQNVLQRILLENSSSKLIRCFICKYILPLKTWLPMCKAVTSLICHYCGMYSNSIYSNKEALFWKDLNRLHLLKDNHYLCLVPPFNTKSKISLQKMQKRQSRDYCTSRRLWQRILSFYRN